MNYNPMVTRTSTCIPSHTDLANLSYSHAGGSGFTAGVKRTAEEAGLKQELDSESLISSEDEDPLTEDLSNSYVTRAMNIPVSSTAATMPNIPHLSHFPGMAASTGLLQSCVPTVPSSSTSSQSQPGGKAPNGKKTKGRVKIKMEFIDNKLRRYTTFSKRKTGIMKKAYELSTLTGTQVMLLVASETGHVYTFATRKLQPMITSEAGKALIQTCLNSPDPPLGAGPTADQRMTPSGYEETELSYNIGAEDEQKFIGVSREGSPVSSCSGSASASPTQDLLASANTSSSPSAPKSSPAPMPISSGMATILAKGIGSVSNANGESSSPRMTMVPSTQQVASVLSSASTAGVSSPVMYQTAQGVVYAVPSPAHRTAIPEGVLLNLGSYLAAQQHAGSDNSKGSPGIPPKLIPIPLTVGLDSSSTSSTSTSSSSSHHHHHAKSRK